MVVLVLAAGGRVAAAAGPSDDLQRIPPSIRNGLANGGWRYDAYPDLESLDAHRTITVADLHGPGQINTIHIAQMYAQPFQQGILFDTARAVVLEIFFDGAELPAVSVPLGDFFADGTGMAQDFSTSFVEKSPGAYNCYIPMPFRKSARVTLRNDTDRDLYNYTAVEWQTLPSWSPDLAYFHASWRRLSFELTPDTKKDFFTLHGPGKFVGEYWLVQTDEPLFSGLTFVMEANNEFRIDGEKEPSINYLGSECSFNFCWGWKSIFNGYKIGTNFLDKKTGTTVVSTYRFRDRDAIYFKKDLGLTLNWTAELKKIPFFANLLDQIRQHGAHDGAWVDYAVTTYWYSETPGGAGETLPPAAVRLEPPRHSAAK